MPSEFPSPDLLLRTPLARRLYHEHASALPVIDYHSHLPVADLATDRRYRDLTELWIESDQYKHRALRILGTPERLVTGDATPREKFDAWAAALPQTIANPLFHWSALELQRYFGAGPLLGPESADEIWSQVNAQLAGTEHTARRLLAAARVELVCTSDQWLDDLAPHRVLAAWDGGPRVLPSLRADEALAVDEPGFAAWVGRLAEATGVRVTDLESYRAALIRRLDHFSAHGCTIADHGIDRFDFAFSGSAAAGAALARVLAGTPPDAAGSRALRSWILATLGAEYGRRGWVLQLHLGAERHTSSRLRRLAGRAGGFAAIGAPTSMDCLCRFLDHLEQQGSLPKTILYPLNPANLPPFAALTGSFAEDGTPGKIQLGPPWWFNDHDHGIRLHLDTLGNIGILSTFVGMTTDARNVLSLSRHDYFRRVLCDWFGQQVASGRLPDDEALLAGTIRRLAYDNARQWLPAPLPSSVP